MLTFLDALKRILVGRPFRTDRPKLEPLSKRMALPVFSANAFSSVAYAPDEILLTLALAGVAAVSLSPLVGIAVMVVLLTIIASYRQSVHAYPSGGGDYEIATKNLGSGAGITVASALMVDFVLTVAVSMSSAAQYLVAAFPALAGRQPWAAAIGIVLLALLNIRGVGRGRRAIAVPTYSFIGVVLLMCIVGFIQNLGGTLRPAASAAYEIVPQEAFSAGLTGVAGALLILRAFSTGSAALTGVEAPITNVQQLKAPKARNAAAVLLLLGVISAAMTLGVMYLARAAGVQMVQDPARQLRLDGADPAGYIQKPVLGQLAEAVFAPGSVLFFVVLAVTALVLILASHSAFNSFPALTSILAADGYLPRQLRTRGDRLSHSNGILALAAAALVLVFMFQADIASLLQLYVIGVFVSFTFSQLGMIRHWGRELRSTPHTAKRLRILRSRTISMIGLIMTATVLVIVIVTKFAHGAWLAVLAIGVLYLIMYSIHRHYEAVAKELAIDEGTTARALPSRVHAVILVSSVRKPVMRALAFARASRPSRLDAITVDLDPEETAKTLADWDKYQIPVPITVLASPYRETAGPILGYIKNIRRDSPRDLIVVYIPEYVVGRWWEQLVHNQTALRIKTRLHFEPGVMVASVPWQLASSENVRRFQDL